MSSQWKFRNIFIHRSVGNAIHLLKVIVCGWIIKLLFRCLCQQIMKTLPFGRVFWFWMLLGRMFIWISYSSVWSDLYVCRNKIKPNILELMLIWNSSCKLEISHKQEYEIYVSGCEQNLESRCICYMSAVHQIWSIDSF